MRTGSILGLVLAVVGAQSARAQPVTQHAGTGASEPDSDPTLAESSERATDPNRRDSDAASPAEPDQTSAADVKDAPLPHQASGVRVPRDKPSRLLWIPRIALAPVQVAAHLVMLPVAGSAWVYERYELRDRFYRIFFNDTETLGLYPIAYFESGFGLNAGARFVYRDLFGERGTLSARAGFGGAKPQSYSVEADTGDLFGSRFRLELRGSYEDIASSRFFGIGNSDIGAMPGAAVDPLVDGPAVATRYRHDDIRLRLSGLARLGGDFQLGLHGEYQRVRFADDPDIRGDADIADVYDTSRLTGFEDGVTSIYPELELRYDSRRVSHYYLSRAAYSSGWLASLFGGYQVGLGEGGAQFPRLGLDLQRYFDLYKGDRVLVTRLFVEGAGGPLDEIPFVDLPALGGSHLLRGYRRDRFRDRRAGMFSVEYQYPISFVASGYLFSEVGRAWRNWDDLSGTEVGDLRVGFGGGVQFHSRNSFLARVSVFSSIDGKILFSLSFDPAWEIRSRNMLF